jgi:hypothetical protein
MWTIMYTTSSTYRRPIVLARTAFILGDGKKQVIVPYLRMYKSIPGSDGSMVPLTYDNRAFRDDRRRLLQFKLPHPNDVSKENGDDFIIPFMAGNLSTSTSQNIWRDRLAAAIEKATGFDCNQINESNLEEKNEELNEALKNKDLECNWSCWRDPYNKGRWYYGPNGEHLKIV